MDQLEVVGECVGLDAAKVRNQRLPPGPAHDSAPARRAPSSACVREHPPMAIRGRSGISVDYTYILEPYETTLVSYALSLVHPAQLAEELCLSRIVFGGEKVCRREQQTPLPPPEAILARSISAIHIPIPDKEMHCSVP